jgi:hypothetical protein
MACLLKKLDLLRLNIQHSWYLELVADGDIPFLINEQILVRDHEKNERKT